MTVLTVSLTPRERRHQRIRSRVHGSSMRPRLAVFRSLKHIYAQLIDDDARTTLLTVSDSHVKTSQEAPVELTAKVRIAYVVGQTLAARAREKKIEAIVFDRGGYKYHGRVKALADGARAGGLKF